MTLHDRLVSVLTEYDRKEEEKAAKAKPGRGYFNKYALGHYMDALYEVDVEIARGVPVRKALTGHFTGRLVDKLLKVAGEGKSTDVELRITRGNPADDAAAMYESFHGTPSTQETVIRDQVHYHENLAELGVLCGLKVRVVSGYDVTLSFGVGARGRQEGNPATLYHTGTYSEYSPAHEKASRLQRDGYAGIQIIGKAPKFRVLFVVRDGQPVPSGAILGDPARYDNPEGKRRSKRKPGPLTQAYRFGTGIVPGILEGADSAVGEVLNPAQARYLLFSTTMQRKLGEHGPHTISGPTIRVPHGTRIEQIEKKGRRILVKGEFDGPFYGWLDDSDMATAAAYRSAHGADPEGMRSNPAGDGRAWMKMADGRTKAQAEALAKKLKAQDRKLRALGSTGNYSAVEVRSTFEHGDFNHPKTEYGVFVLMQEGNPSWGKTSDRWGAVVTDAGGMTVVFTGTEQEVQKVVAQLKETGKKASSQRLRAGSGARRGWQRPNPAHDFGPVLLCSNESGNQLYFRGGDQALDLASIKMAEYSRDHMVIGEVWGLAYNTKKEFDDFQSIDYVHILGLEKFHQKMPKKADLWDDALPPFDEAFGSGNLPTLTYDTLSGQLSLAGGVYKIEKPWSGVSPGIEN